ncbi:phosphatase and actin regulator 4A-like [Corticium candelabrum]|uniref:phosphatase and actin regulator 4A-like n=1 Tax=Corticium candelabrum TaxID=121492 RepID=UPI002E26895F|nr:phosphatase and actin regulator 4A-like [Corticium candelabrum]
MTSRARSMSDSQTLKDDVLANGVGHEGASVRGDSSEKKMSTLSRLLRPWKWRRKKKSKQFVDTSTKLERKLSVRSQRQDLIRRGLLKPEDAPVDLVVVDTRYVATGKSKQPPVPPAKPARSRGTTELLSRSGAGADKQRAASDSDIRSSLNGAATERGVRFGASSQIGEEHRSGSSQLGRRPFPTPVLPGSPKKLTLNADVGPLTVQRQHTSTEQETGRSPGKENVEIEDDEEDEEDVPQSGLLAKVQRKDSLARHLEGKKTRAPPPERPSEISEEERGHRHEVTVKLTRQLSQRPTAQELRERGILRTRTSREVAEDMEEKKRTLNRKLTRRPTVKELRDKKILIRFADYAEVVDADEYDRRADKPWTKLRPSDKAAIRKELNDFKSTEMEVHPESAYMTRFHKP